MRSESNDLATTRDVDSGAIRLVAWSTAWANTWDVEITHGFVCVWNARTPYKVVCTRLDVGQHRSRPKTEAHSSRTTYAHVLHAAWVFLLQTDATTNCGQAVSFWRMDGLIALGENIRLDVPEAVLRQWQATVCELLNGSLSKHILQFLSSVQCNSITFISDSSDHNTQCYAN